MDPSPIGVSLLTRFAQGANKDLVCKYVRYLSPLQIVTDLRSDPEDPTQWEPGQMGRVHRESWLEHRRWVLDKLYNECFPTEKRFGLFAEMLTISTLLNYMDIVTELLKFRFDSEIVGDRDIKFWNILYGPFRGRRSIARDAVRHMAWKLTWENLFEPLRTLFTLYPHSWLREGRSEYIETAIGHGNTQMTRFLIENLGKPPNGQRFLEAAAKGPSSENFRYLMTQYEIREPGGLIHSALVLGQSPENYRAIPAHIRKKHTLHWFHIVFGMGLAKVLPAVLDDIDPRELHRIHITRVDDNVSVDDIYDTVHALVSHPNIDFSRDLDLLPVTNRVLLEAFLDQPEVQESITREELDQLLEKWSADQPIAEKINGIIRRRFQRPELEGEPPTKMIKDFVNFYI